MRERSVYRAWQDIQGYASLLFDLPERLTWPEATVQTCVVHMVRNSLRYSSKKHWAKITAAMREIYTAPTVEAAEARFAEFAGEWQQLYPAMI